MRKVATLTVVAAITVALAAVFTTVATQPGATAIEYGLPAPVAAAAQPDATAIEYGL